MELERHCVTKDEFSPHDKNWVLYLKTNFNSEILYCRNSAKNWEKGKLRNKLCNQLIIIESVNENLIRVLVCSQRKSYSQVSEILKEMFPEKIGFSRRSIQRYWLEKSISETIKQEEVTTMVERTVIEVDF